MAINRSDLQLNVLEKLEALGNKINRVKHNRMTEQKKKDGQNKCFYNKFKSKASLKLC